MNTEDNPTPSEYMFDWTDIGDNRIGPALRQAVEGIVDLENPDEIRRIASRLKYLASSVYSHANRMEAAG